MLLRLALPALLAAAVLAGCASNSDGGDGDAADAPRATPAPSASTLPRVSGAAPSPAAPSAAPAAATAPITILDVAPLPTELASSIAAGAFADPRIEATRGATITWTNDDAVTHFIASDDGQFSGSGPLAPGMSFQRTFLAPGEYAFHCAFHPDMKGVVAIA